MGIKQSKETFSTNSIDEDWCFDDAQDLKPPAPEFPPVICRVTSRLREEDVEQFSIPQLAITCDSERLAAAAWFLEMRPLGEFVPPPLPEEFAFAEGTVDVEIPTRFARASSAPPLPELPACDMAFSPSPDISPKQPDDLELLAELKRPWWKRLTNR